MKKIIYFLLIITVFFITAYFFIKPKTEGIPNMACFQKHCFELEIAKTPEQRAKGLMFREYLEKNEAMLFIYSNSGIYKFWMKNTLIPLDIIWLNSSQEVIFIEHNAPPCPSQNQCPLFGPDDFSKYVLEFNAGTAREIGLMVGDKILFKY